MLTDGQNLALQQLGSVQAANPAALHVLATTPHDDGRLRIEISLDTRGFAHVPGGVRMRNRERFTIEVGTEFPFVHPIVRTRHQRWADAPHVQWTRQICLYQAPALEWDPSDGMFGLLDRLLAWLISAALDELDPVGAPLHPPVAYSAAGTPLVIPRADAPRVTAPWWLGLAEMRAVSDIRLEIDAWHSLGSGLPPIDTERRSAAAVLLAEPLPFEYPATMAGLIAEFGDQGLDKNLLMALLRLAALLNADGTPLHVVVGAPMRGIRGGRPLQHLAVWQLTAAAADLLRAAVPRSRDDDRLRALRSEIADAVERWASTATLSWCRVREARSEIVNDRTSGSPMQWFAGRTVSLWGCGALGSHVAESLARAGIARLVLRDSGIVAPGLLARQAFDDADIGYGKAAALRARLLRLRPDLDVVANPHNVLTDTQLAADWTDGADVIFDLTASPAVAKRLERLRTATSSSSTAVASMLIGHRTDRSMLCYSPPDCPAGPADVLRKAKIAAARDPDLREFAEEFWPDPPRTTFFQPEPGCSEPTFTGADAEVAALAASMLTSTAQELAAATPHAAVTFSVLPDVTSGRDGRTARRSWPDDLVTHDPLAGYAVRISPTALAELHAWLRRQHRADPGVETGGLLFGERDDAAGVLWVTDVLGPPPDSTASAAGFLCGTAGVDAAAAMLRARSRGGSTPIGMWHTHPNGPAQPSPTDLGGMRQLVDGRDRPLPRQLLLIVGGSADAPTFGTWLYERDVPRTQPRRAANPLPRPPSREEGVGVALSGGGFRAVAFHLGTLRALHDRGVLDRVDVISAVSGGALIAAMWAYSDSDFAAFDQKVTQLLRTGLTRDIARALLLSRHAPQAAAATLRAAAGTIASRVVNAAARPVSRGPRRRRRMQPPFRRTVTRTTALQDVLAAKLFGHATIDQPRRDVHVVINATDLRSGSAYRFGSTESGCTRYGTLVDNAIPVAAAVAASAAFPLLLPVVDRHDTYRGRDGTVRDERVMLTDGGVYDNLATTSLRPGRSRAYSTNVHPVDYVVSCDAGYGIMDATAFPQWWPSRIARSFGAVHRKAQDAQRAALHAHVAAGELRGFAMAFLGQQDQRLPVQAPDLVPRSRVVDYPTNFSPMTDDDIAALATRGEQLTRLTIDHHCPEIS